MRLKFKVKKAFTLIELLIVVSIIGIIASVVLIGLTAARKNSKDKAVLSEMVQINKYILECKNAPNVPAIAYPALNTSDGSIVSACPAGSQNYPDLSRYEGWKYGGQNQVSVSGSFNYAFRVYRDENNSNAFEVATDPYIVCGNNIIYGAANLTGKATCLKFGF